MDLLGGVGGEADLVVAEGALFGGFELVAPGAVAGDEDDAEDVAGFAGEVFVEAGEVVEDVVFGAFNLVIDLVEDEEEVAFLFAEEFEEFAEHLFGAEAAGGYLRCSFLEEGAVEGEA